MKKLSFISVALLTITLVFSSSLTSRLVNTDYVVYGIISEYPCLSEEDWDDYIPVLNDAVEAPENPTTQEPSPFEEEPSLSDFEETCETSPEIVCIIVVKRKDNVVVEILAVTCGEFQGWES